MRKRATKKRTRTRTLFAERLEARLCLAAVPVFESLPGADHTILLDFDGHTTTGTTWNSSYGISTIVSPPYDIDGDTATFNSTELQRIESAWEWVAEDFAPFEINVTTVDPGASALSYSGGGDTQWGVRVVITDDTFASCGCGGHAFVGSFDDSQDEPVFVYNSSLKGVSEASTHEAGHALGLRHDGQTGSAYYWGHGSGATSWAPLMGASYNRNVTQWSQGDYFDGSNSEDDLAILSSLSNGNGFGYRVDDHGDNDASATVLVGNSIGDEGIIETTSDVDVFSFNTGAGNVTIDIDPANIGANLDIKAEVYDSGGALVATSDPASVLDATFSLNLSAGQYYLHVDGVGTGDPLSSTPTGYTEYGSLGAYTVSGTVVDPGNLPSLSIDDVTVDEDAGTAVFTVSLTGTVGDPVSVDFATKNGTATGSTNSSQDYGTKNGNLVFNADGSQTISVTIDEDGMAEGAEDFFVNLDNATNASIGDGQGVGTITDNDTEISINDVSTNEGNAAKGKKNAGNTQLKDFVFTVSLSNSVGHDVTVTYGTADGAATIADNDYQSANGEVTIAAGATTATVTVSVVGDNNSESDEDFTVGISSANGDVIDGEGIGTILDDDTKGGGGGGGGNGRGKKKAAAETELQDPIWWFEEHSHDHRDENLPAFEDIRSSELVRAIIATASKRSTSPIDDVVEMLDSETANGYFDLALTQLAVQTPAASGQAEFLASDDDISEAASHEDLIDSVLSELGNDFD